MTAVPSGWTPEQARQRLDDKRHGWPVDALQDIAALLALLEQKEHAKEEAWKSYQRAVDAERRASALLDDARETLEQIASLTPFQPPSNPAGVGNAPRLARAFLARFAADKDST